MGPPRSGLRTLLNGRQFIILEGKYMSDSLISWAKIKKEVITWAGAIGANGDEKDMLNAARVAQKRVDEALKMGSVLQFQNSDAFQKLADASGYLTSIIGYLEKAEKIHKDIKAVQQIWAAVQVLKDENILYNDPAAAAAAFDGMFEGFGKLAKHFPPPFDTTIGEFLEQCGGLKFFSNMNRVMAGEGSNLYRAKQLLYDTRD